MGKFEQKRPAPHGAVYADDFASDTTHKKKHKKDTTRRDTTGFAFAQTSPSSAGK
jgi:hypothetical protein